MKYQMFLSYSGRDRKFAAAVKRELKKLAVTAFDPQADLKAGSPWRETVEDAIRASNQVVVFMTEPYAERGWVGDEVSSASALGKEVVVMKPRSLLSQLAIAV